MILSEYDILHRQQQAFEKVKTGSQQNQLKAKMVGHKTQYFFAIRDGEKVIGICGLPVKILSIYQKEDGQLDDEDYFVDLAVETRVPEFYTEVKGILVTSISLTDQKGNCEVGLCNYADVNIVNEIMNEKYARAVGRPKLQLVVNKVDKQDTPDQQS